MNDAPLPETEYQARRERLAERMEEPASTWSSCRRRPISST